jgi:ubiquinone/menaquinone biosynthesis C-methylase UbiE
MNSEKDVKEVIKERWDKRGFDYDRSPGHGIHSEREKEAWKNLLAQALGTENETLDVLDVGCGTGVISLLLAELEHNVTGIDLSEGMLKKAKEKARTFNLPVEFKNGDAENPPFEDEAFDAIINRHLLWTLPNPEQAMEEWKRVLKPEGKVIIIDGSWGDYSRLRRQIWRYFVSMPLILITERRNPGHRPHNKDIEKQLPMRHRKRPQADMEILENLGFSVDVMDVTIPRTQSFLNSLKYGHWGDRGYFMVKGIK